MYTCACIFLNVLLVLSLVVGTFWNKCRPGGSIAFGSRQPPNSNSMSCECKGTTSRSFGPLFQIEILGIIDWVRIGWFRNVIRSCHTGFSHVTHVYTSRERKEKRVGKKGTGGKEKKGKKKVGGRGDLGRERESVLKNRVGPRTNTAEDCSIRPLAPLFEYLEIWKTLFDRMSAPSFAGSPWCAFTVAVPAAILFRSIWMTAAKTFASDGLTKFAFPPSPIHLLSTFRLLQQSLVVTQVQQRLLYRRVSKR